MTQSLLFLDKVSVNRDAFGATVKSISGKMGMNPDWLMAVMNFETGGTFSPSVRNPQSSATGLIQFMDSTARELGTTTAALAKMSNVDQLLYVQKYFQNVISRHGAIKNIADAYLAVFYPAAIAWPLDKVFPQAVFNVNRVFDGNKDGQITKQEIIDTITATIPAPYQLSVQKNTMNKSFFIIGLVLIILGAYVAWQSR